MKRREFLQKGLALGATLLPGVGLNASEWLPLSSMVADGAPKKQIWQAACDGHWSIVKQLLEGDPTLITVTNTIVFDEVDDDYNLFDSTLLHIAAAFSPQVKVIKMLASLGADVNARDAHYHAPLHMAAMFNSNVDISKCLVSLGAYPHVASARYSSMATPAACWNNVEVLQYLLSKSVEDSLDRLLDHAAENNPNVDVFQYLVSLGASVHKKDVFGDTPLHLVANRGGYENDIEIIKYLLNAGADVHTKNNKGETPLDIADSEAKKRILREWM